MKTYNQENSDYEETDLTNNWPYYAAPDDLEDDEEDEIDENTDWGDVDPAGGDAPSSPGSAV